LMAHLFEFKLTAESVGQSVSQPASQPAKLSKWPSALILVHEMHDATLEYMLAASLVKMTLRAKTNTHTPFWPASNGITTFNPKRR